MLKLKDFIKGIRLINLFPQERESLEFKPLSVHEAFKKNLEQVGKAMCSAVSIIDKELTTHRKFDSEKK